jgi:TetR/AcrR family transcriptional regulator, transcriptional repressor for nem operon
MDLKPSVGNPSTRDRILALAEASVLEKGFAATSIEELIVGAGITKSGFFYHFRDKGELAKVLLQRYLDKEEAILDELTARADELHEDPLHSFLIALKMFAELMQDLPETHPGCLVASYCYQENLFNADVRELNRAGVLRWRRRFRDRLDLIVARYPPRHDVDLNALADMLSAIVDGGIIISKVVRDKDVLPKQVMLFREFVRAIFLGPQTS